MSESLKSLIINEQMSELLNLFSEDLICSIFLQNLLILLKKTEISNYTKLYPFIELNNKTLNIFVYVSKLLFPFHH